MKNFLLITLFLIPVMAFGDNIVSNAMIDFKNDVSTFYPAMQQAALGLFGKLALIEIVITFGFMALRGEIELGGVVAHLIKLLLIFGVFQFLLMSPDVFLSIAKGFAQLASNATGGISSFDTAVDKLIVEWVKWDELDVAIVGGDDVSTVLASFFALLFLTVTFALLGGQLLGTYAFTMFAVYVGVFWLGFAPFSQSRQWAIHAVTNVIKWGAKYMVTLLIMSLGIVLVNNMMASDLSQISNLAKAMLVGIMIITVNAGSSSFVDGYFSGMGGGDNSRGVQLAMNASSAVAGGAVGMASGAVGNAVANLKAQSDTATATGSPSPSMMDNFKTASSSIVSGMLKGAVEGSEKGLKNSMLHPSGLSSQSNFGMGKSSPSYSNPNNSSSNNSSSSSNSPTPSMTAVENLVDGEIS